MSNNTTSSIITIGRKYGSAGRQIGQEVAKYFGINELPELSPGKNNLEQVKMCFKAKDDPYWIAYSD